MTDDPRSPADPPGQNELARAPGGDPRGPLAGLDSRFLAAVIDHIPINIFIKDAKDLHYVLLNREAERLLGRARSEMLGKSDFDLFSKENAEQSVAEDREVFKRGEIIEIPGDVVFVPGKGERIFHTRKVPLYDEEGRPLYLLGIAEDITEQREAEEVVRKELLLRETQKKLLEVIRELSTPVIPIHEGILVVPLVGQLDSARSAQFLEVLLSGIQRHRAEMVLIDITGVAVVDSAVAGHLIQATRAARLLGASCILVGLSPSVAQTMVELGVDFGDLITHRDLQAGVQYALARRGLDDKGRP